MNKRIQNLDKNLFFISKNMKSLKCVVEGDDQVGKTSLIITYKTNVFPCEYAPSLFVGHLVNVRVENQSIKLHLWDSENYLNRLSFIYESTDCFILCFSLVLLKSLENIENIYVPEIKKYCPDTPYILVGTQSDLRDIYEQYKDEFKSKGWQPIPSSKGEEMKNKIGAQYYVECSSFNQHHLDDVFELATKVALHSPNQTKVSCSEDAQNSCCIIM